MILDQYGKHTILSLYYDNLNYTLIRNSIKKPTYKEKFRVRCYGKAKENEEIYLEIKKKYQGIVYKRRMSLPYYQLDTFNRYPKSLVPDSRDKQVKKEIDYMMTKYHLFPRVLICYDREAFFGKEDSNFRITFDHQIRYRKDNLNFHTGSAGELVAPEVDVLMEVKAMGAYPTWFSQILSAGEIYPGSFSKYAYVYKKYLSKNQELVEEKNYVS